MINWCGFMRKYCIEIVVIKIVFLIILVFLSYSDWKIFNLVLVKCLKNILFYYEFFINYF